jgi:hypothetical protein
MFSARPLLIVLTASAALMSSASASAQDAWQSESLGVHAPMVSVATSSPDSDGAGSHGIWPRPVTGEPGGDLP